LNGSISEQTLVLDILLLQT